MVRPNAGTKGVPRAEREQQIVFIASRRFGTDGYAATHLSAVAKTAGISKPLIYNYFGSKEGLYARCLDEAGELLGNEIERIAEGDAVGLERGIRTLDGMFAILDNQRHIWRLLHDPSAPLEGPIAEVVGRHTARLDQLAHEGVRELLTLVGDDDARDASVLTAVWLGIIDSLMEWWVAHPEEPAAHMSERVTRLIMSVFSDAALSPA